MPLSLKLLSRLSLVFLAGVLLSGCTGLERKNVGGLQVITENSSASLFLDGQYLDKSPYINKSIKPGQYTLRIEPEDKNLTPHETQVAIRRSLLTVVTWKPGPTAETSGGVVYEMEPIQSRHGELVFITIPDNALVKVDQQEQQFSPVTIKDLEPGLHQYEIFLTAYETQQHSINILAGHRVTVTAKLARLPEVDQETTRSTITPPASNSTALAAASGAAATQSASTSQSASAAANLAGRIPKPRVTITATNYFQDEVEVLRVRDKASNAGQEVGLAEVGAVYPYAGETSQGWYKINFNGKQGWVSTQFSQLEE